MSRIDDEVEKFVRRYYDLELIIEPAARTIEMKGVGDTKSFADCLQRAMIEYMLSENADELTRKNTTTSIFAFMTKAYAYGVISSGQELLGKLDECRRKNMELVKDLAICMANYTALQKKYDQIVKNINEKPTEAETGEDDEQQQRT
jgi:hypothetical protein